MLALLTRALAARAQDVARWHEGYDVVVEPPRVTHQPRQRATDDRGGAAEFRIEIGGPLPTTYIVTVAEVRTL